MLGTLFLVAAFLSALKPATLTVEERDAADKLTKMITSQVARTEITALCIVTGSVLFLFCMNGTRLSKFTIGSVSAESRPAEVIAADQAARKGTKLKEIAVIDNPSEEDTQPKAPEAGNAILSQTALSIYSRDAVPARVLQDALDAWPDESTRPTNLSMLEFAARKPGKGNNPWILKFSGSAPVRVSYGGRGKDDPTVQQH